MPVFKIETTKEEQEKVIEALRSITDEASVSRIAAAARMPSSRVRYVVDDLVESGKVDRIPTKVFNERYKRYRYVVKV